MFKLGLEIEIQSFNSEVKSSRLGFGSVRARFGKD